MPKARLGSLFGTQYQNAALRAVPRISGAFSTRIPSLPSHRENKADGRPPPPPPTTTMSASASKSVTGTGAAVSRAATSCAFAIANPLRGIAANGQVDGLMVSDLLVAVVFQADTPVVQYTPSRRPRPPPSVAQSNCDSPSGALGARQAVDP